MANDGNEKPILNTRQRKAIAALLSSRDVRTAAAVAKVGARTLYRWLAESEPFRAALAEAEGNLIGEATRRLLSLAGDAVDVLEQVLSDPKATNYERLRAAQLTLDVLLKLREAMALEQRLAELEAAVYGTNQ